MCQQIIRSNCSCCASECVWVCPDESLSFLLTSMLLFHCSPLSWTCTDTCSTHINTISSVICYSQHFFDLTSASRAHEHVWCSCVKTIPSLPSSYSYSSLIDFVYIQKTFTQSHARDSITTQHPSSLAVVLNLCKGPKITYVVIFITVIILHKQAYCGFTLQQ